MRICSLSRWIAAASTLFACNERVAPPAATPPAPDTPAARGPAQVDARAAQPEATPPEPAPAPVPPEPPQPDLPPDAVAVQLAADIAALGRADLRSIEGVKSRLHLPVGTQWSPFGGFTAGKTVDVAVAGEHGPLTLRLVMKDGTYEPPRGNGAPRRAPELDGVELRGAVGLPSPSPADATRVDVVSIDGADGREAVTVWGDHVYFRPMPAGGQWYVARYDGRAPFHYTEAERVALEDALIALTRALGEGTSAGDHMTKHHAARRDPASGGYEFGAGSVHVSESQWVSVGLVGPLRLPRLFQAHGMKMLATSFAHDYGEMPRPIRGPGFELHPGLYFFGAPYASMAAAMGDPAEARFVSFTISPLADGAGR